jgi:hypothetical protein
MRVELEAFSPFVPLNLEDSSYPATVLNFTVTNTGRKIVKGELAGFLENGVCLESRKKTDGQLRNQVGHKPNMTFLHCDAIKPVQYQTREEPREDILFDDFESGSYTKWTVEGKAFGDSTKPNFHHQPLRNYKGDGLADSFFNNGKQASAHASDSPKGKMTSQPFTIQRRMIKFLIGGGNHPGQTCLNLIVDGKTVFSATGANSETLQWAGFNVSQHKGKQAYIQIVDNHSGGWGHILVDQIVFTDEKVPTQTLDELPEYGSMGLAILNNNKDVVARSVVESSEALFDAEPSVSAFRNFDADERLLGALGQKFTLKPGKKTTVTFVLTWHFPNFYLRGRNVGRSYDKRFDSAQDVAEHIAANFDRLAGQTRLWHKTWYDSTLAFWFLDRTFLNTSILATNTAYILGDGRFYGSEGVYCCPGTCTHVWGYVQAMGRLLPELEQRLRERTDYNPEVGFHPDSGLIEFRGKFGNGCAVDGQSGVILRTYLTHQMSDNERFLRRNYGSMKKAMNYLVKNYDADADGILTGAQHNTLDARWYGKITWLSLYYQATLRAAGQMADEMGDNEYAEHLRTLAERGRKYIEEKLFNGEYFIHEPDPEHPKSPGVFNGCEYSQLLGQSWAYQVGLGQILDRGKVTTALKSLWKYNFSTDVGPFREVFKGGRWYAMPGEGGLIACTWPYGGEEALTHGNRHFAGYLNECQAGYEYGATSLMMWHGLIYRALAHIRTVHDRYDGAKRNPWNEVECGSHYARSMASYGLFTGICGFEHHGPKGYIAFSPRLTPENFRASFTSARGWGTFSQTRNGKTQTEKIEVRAGKLRLKTLAFDLPEGIQVKNVKIETSGKELDAIYKIKEKRITITLNKETIVDTNQSIVTTISS